MHLMPWAAALSACALLQALSSAADADLARRLRARDPRVMAALYDRYGKLAYSLIFRIVRDGAAAEDLVQETFLRVWNRAHSFDAGRGALGPWILAVARNRAIDHIRSRDGRMAAAAVDLDRMENHPLFARLEDSALSLDRSRRLKAAFAKLPPRHREVIELAYFEGLSQTEMAERMNQPLGTVKTWVRTALKALREELAEAIVA
ncbi:MAG TPA: sigma-70 family RNA polymerase sigma factor [Bryobacteraceae bacterium]|nr:sigma-70 family RNA polymerase sigma factor [Bryobacteraceae bacterium]